MMGVRCLLWDFGDTLCDELSLWRVSPEWMEVYRSFDDGIGAASSLGDVDTRGFAVPLNSTRISQMTSAFLNNRHGVHL